MSRPATPEDVDATCRSLPEVVPGTSWGDGPTLVADGGLPYFTVDHFRRRTAVLLQESRLDELDPEELRKVLTDAWAARAPQRLVRGHLSDA